jgi:protease YdgD
MDKQEGILVMTCDVDFGSSGAPVFRIGPNGVEIVSVVSAKADMQGQKVALGSGLDVPLKVLTKALKQQDHRPGNVQVLSGGQASGSAKFVKPEATEAP